ncbi:MAG: 23S rRNA (adenine(2503)-C(2))-methyltransferase RlmN [Candidatus Kapabacteria bacterium]|nr:23S rRNA (adenine(2503)-C(2))-methyltransferase RlmN [Ignavibacteriota bacterium]MCW5883761.1 23S rRNA (adenine(2503)-C(2))-methyltransferase RlmN [Candidatus Kapabacteria bacterium]
MNKRNNIKNYDIEELENYLTSKNFDKFRAAQIFNGIYSEKFENFNKITTLPLQLKNHLTENFSIWSLKTKKVRESSDGSIKYLFELFDGKSVEAVYMPWYDETDGEIERVTLCISSMAGCPVECAFCATGTMGFQRNLETSEIIDQILFVEKDLGKKITNIVFMGMGEPLLNFTNVVRTISILTHPANKLLTRKKITLSTVGITAKIKHLASTKNPVKLAISLHATTNGFREKIIPMAKGVRLNELMDVVEFYYRKTKMPITYEYIPFESMNDTDEDAVRLARILKRVPSRVNIIPFNDISFTGVSGFAASLKPTKMERVLEFGALVRRNGGAVTIRDTFGTDIEAACGQLALAE